MMIKDNLEDLDIDESVILKWWDEEAWNGSIWLRIRTGGGLL
jgi:hypothetical protein